MGKISLVIHGGAGTILKTNMTLEKESQYKQALQDALDVGYKILENNGTAMDAVKAAVVSLEDCILFNAGRGSVFTHKGTHEMDASIMNGKTLQAGAVAGVKNIRNPVLLADCIIKNSEHILLCGEGAEEFAKQYNIQTEPDEYFFSQFRYDQLKHAQESETVVLDHFSPNEKKFGTVGAVACDAEGNIAAATSTGGMTNKKFGRVGDTPIIGSGTYANNKTCAISCTGHGEPFMQTVTAYDVSCLMEYKGFSLQLAMEEVTLKKLVVINGEGGMIGVDAKGNAAMVFNSDGMYRGMKCSDGLNEVSIYK
ncbi:MAG: isoaspartyl peptidase/L-asparaginase [Bacteroidetes bacterium]|nr:MAG: isoaspartyl peptidase/L-asparaginase [Bacteroidota bacterium]